MLSKITISKLFCVSLVFAFVLALNFAIAKTNEKTAEKKTSAILGPPYNDA
jgi:ABC-type arginine/histidine transport system permease subunit